MSSYADWVGQTQSRGVPEPALPSQREPARPPGLHMTAPYRLHPAAAAGGPAEALRMATLTLTTPALRGVYLEWLVEWRNGDGGHALSRRH